MSSDEPVEHDELQRARWRSRRGMRELDLILVPFAERAYPRLGPELRAAYAALLEEEDQDLLAWLQGTDPPPARWVELVGLIRAARSGWAARVEHDSR